MYTVVTLVNRIPSLGNGLSVALTRIVYIVMFSKSIESPLVVIVPISESMTKGKVGMSAT